MSLNEKNTQIVQLMNPEIFRHAEAGIKNLLHHYQEVLLDDACTAGCEGLINNLKNSLPHVWVLLLNGQVKALCNLTDEIENRHAFIHGLSYPDIWDLGFQTDLAMVVMRYAFTELRVLKVKAEFERDNKTALGFCWRYGFTREGYFKADTRMNGCLKDVVIYSLTEKRYKKLAQQFYGCNQNEKENEHVIRS